MITALLIAQPIVMLLWWYPNLTILAKYFLYQMKGYWCACAKNESPSS